MINTNKMQIRKRTIIAIIITTVIVFITNKYWFIIRPLPVNFDILGHGNCNIEVQFNKKNNDEFKKIKSESIQVNLDEQKHVDIFVNRAKYPKRLKIIISNISSIAPITISNIQFRDGRFKLDNISKFKVDGADVTSKDNSLVLTPDSDTMTLIYPDILHIRARMDFDFMVFGIIFILTFLIAYKLSNYVAEFNTIKGKSRVEIIFLTIFFVFLFIPMSHINQDEILEKENRTLAKWQPLILENNEINYDFGSNFNEWFNDRFCLRTEFINLHNNIIISFNEIYQTSKATYDKKYHLLYTGNFYGLQDNTSKDNKNIDYIIENIKNLNNYCDKNNIKLYILVVPRKSIFCKHTIINLQAEKSDKAENIIKALEQQNINIIYPKNEMLEVNKVTPVYFKTDHHWTKKGTYIGYKELINKIKIDFPEVKLLKDEDLEQYFSDKVSEHWDSQLNNGQTFNLIGFPEYMSKKILDTEYIYYKNPYRKYLVRNSLRTQGFKINNDGKFDDYFYYPYGANIKVLVIGNSFARNLVEFLPYSFKYTVRFYDNDQQIKRNMNMKYYEPFIQEYKPDILVLNFQTSYFNMLANLYKEGN